VTGVLVHEGCSKGLLSQRIRTKEAAADRSTHVELSMTGETVVMAQWGGASSGILHLLIFCNWKN
jgi:hypothetical protein